MNGCSFFHVTTECGAIAIAKSGFIMPEKSRGKRKCIYAVQQDSLEWACRHIVKRHNSERVVILGIVNTWKVSSFKRAGGKGNKYFYSTSSVGLGWVQWVGVYFYADNIGLTNDAYKDALSRTEWNYIKASTLEIPF